VVIGIEVRHTFIEDIVLTCVDNGLPESFRETRFPVCTKVAVGDVRDQESPATDFYAEAVINKAGAGYIGENAQRKASSGNRWAKYLIYDFVQFFVTELHRHENCLRLDLLVLQAVIVVPALERQLKLKRVGEAFPIFIFLVRVARKKLLELQSEQPARMRLTIRGIYDRENDFEV
jgi:hypothetical protein